MLPAQQADATHTRHQHGFCTATIEALRWSTAAQLLAKELTAGQVIVASATPSIICAMVVVDTTSLSNAHSVAIRQRPVMGGNDTLLILPGDRPVQVRATNGIPLLLAPDLVPDVPEARVPKNPATGDRILSQWATSTASWARTEFTFDGTAWVNSLNRPTSTLAVDKAVTATEHLRDHWYVYSPAADRPHLYVDGRAYPAKPVADLQPGDVIPLPGGGLLALDDVVHDVPGQPGYSGVFGRIAAPSVYPWAHHSRVLGERFSDWHHQHLTMPVLARTADFEQPSAFRTGQRAIDTDGRHLTLLRFDTDAYTAVTPMRRHSPGPLLQHSLTDSSAPALLRLSRR
ncbi:hypothetical protein [Kitasatospora viridis]|uniref:Uncharacterized protein n=1 Tax=Kitasatospora viridis TaxID=281105 RepID=A0A561SAA4_9ACTN|nr:hypothetical protein [Kitasatospora viridis]TWF71735.1 hypothetical protein FHX73_18106 [Kitasatospora viridis]